MAQSNLWCHRLCLTYSITQPLSIQHISGTLNALKKRRNMVFSSPPLHALHSTEVLSTSFTFRNSSLFLLRSLSYIHCCLSFWPSNVSPYNTRDFYTGNNCTERKILHVSVWTVTLYFHILQKKKQENMLKFLHFKHQQNRKPGKLSIYQLTLTKKSSNKRVNADGF